MGVKGYPANENIEVTQEGIKALSATLSGCQYTCEWKKATAVSLTVPSVPSVSGSTGVANFTAAGTVAISQASPGVVTLAGHGLSANRELFFRTTGTLPTGLTVYTHYYVKTVIDTDTFTVSATAGGTAINTTSAGSGTHTLWTKDL